MIPGHLKEVLHAARKQGFKWTLTPGGHIKIIPPGSARLIFTGSSPSDRRSVRNLIRDLRHAGFKWRGR